MDPFISYLATLAPTTVLNATFKEKDFVPIDLSSQNNQITKTLLQDADAMENYINGYCKTNQAKVAYGGYNETRSLYKRSSLFQEQKTAERNIHIGLDLWLEAGSEIFAPVAGYIHSFKNNIALGDYGPTIILEHRSKNKTWYTLYGHLSLESISDVEIGMYIEKGDVFATLGNANVNGNYAPHLHFQIIKELNNYTGDYPGVCAKEDLAYYLENCPDPKILLGLS